MKCINCGAILEEDSKFCVSCGTKQEEVKAEQIDSLVGDSLADFNPQQMPVAGEQPAKKTKKAKMVKLIVGTLFILIGLQRVLSAGTSISSTSFGADFYTYTYRGIVAISEILASIQVSLGWVIAAIGAAIDVSAFKD